jgi:hypothetical protein
MVEIIENNGDVWFMKDNKPFMYFNNEGSMHINGNVKSLIPSQFDLVCKKITDYYKPL